MKSISPDPSASITENTLLLNFVRLSSKKARNSPTSTSPEPSKSMAENTFSSLLSVEFEMRAARRAEPKIRTDTAPRHSPAELAHGRSQSLQQNSNAQRKRGGRAVCSTEEATAHPLPDYTDQSDRRHRSRGILAGRQDRNFAKIVVHLYTKVLKTVIQHYLLVCEPVSL